MQRYILLRLGTGLISLALVSLIIFIILRIVPGDPAIVFMQSKYGEDWQQFTTAQEIADERARLGTDRPLPEQYWSWVWGLVRLDLGHSYLTRTPVFEELSKAFPFTAQVIILAILVAATLGISMGMLAAVRQYTLWDYASRIFSISGISMPNFFIATLVIYGLLRLFHWIPPLGYAQLWNDPVKALQQIWWPVLVLGFGLAAVTARMTRSQMLEILREDYIRTAYSKGLAARAVYFRHALRNAMLPVVTIIGSQFSHLLGGAVIIETIFNIPGLGVKLIDSLRLRDYLVTQDAIMLIATFVILGNLMVDLSYAWLDPRIRYR